MVFIWWFELPDFTFFQSITGNSMNILELLEDFQKHYSCDGDIEIINEENAEI